MKGKIYAFLIWILMPGALIAFLSSCEDCYKCGFDQQEPYFNVKFFNADSLSSINDSIAALDEATKNLRTERSTKSIDLNAAIDSLEGKEDPLVIDFWESAIDSIQLELENLDEKINALGFYKTGLNQVKRKITSGAVPLQSITSPQGKEIPFVSGDSLTAYKFPLPMNDSQAQYFIKINDSTYSLSVAYHTELVTENGSVVIKADSLRYLSSSNFDSLKIYYSNDLRKTDETYFHLYF